ncbi:uncharacterized protein [Dendrobates tinctorius]|uniref:uncharacterized protein n=1 Tax=Dendrobates tinctorius TaxID=92724 RepID=UPI003CC99CC1
MAFVCSFSQLPSWRWSLLRIRQRSFFHRFSVFFRPETPWQKPTRRGQKHRGTSRPSDHPLLDFTSLNLTCTTSFQRYTLIHAPSQASTHLPLFSYSDPVTPPLTLVNV